MSDKRLPENDRADDASNFDQSPNFDVNLASPSVQRDFNQMQSSASTNDKDLLKQFLQHDGNLFRQDPDSNRAGSEQIVVDHLAAGRLGADRDHSLNTGNYASMSDLSFDRQPTADVGSKSSEKTDDTPPTNPKLELQQHEKNL